MPHHVRFPTASGPTLKSLDPILSRLRTQSLTGGWRIGKKINGPRQEVEIIFDDANDAMLARLACTP